MGPIAPRVAVPHQPQGSRARVLTMGLLCQAVQDRDLKFLKGQNKSQQDHKC